MSACHSVGFYGKVDTDFYSPWRYDNELALKNRALRSHGFRKHACLLRMLVLAIMSNPLKNTSFLMT